MKTTLFAILAGTAAAFAPASQKVASSTSQEVVLKLHPGFPSPKDLWSIPGKPLKQGKYLKKYVLKNGKPYTYVDKKKKQRGGTF